MVSNATQHRVVTLRPGRLATSAAEEAVERVDLERVVHSQDPFRPGEVFDCVAAMGELPVKESRDRSGVEIEEHVLWTEVAVHDDRTVPVEPGNERHREALERFQGCADKLQHGGCVTAIDQILAVVTVQDTQRESGDRRILLDHGCDRQVVSEGREARQLAAGTLEPVLSDVGLLDASRDLSGLVRVSVRQPRHDWILAGLMTLPHAWVGLGSR